MKWLHRLLNPHCIHCIEELRENRICNSCETLRNQLADSNAERIRLFELIIKKETPDNQSVPYTEPLKPTTSRFTPWSTRKQILETEDKEKARILRQHSASVEDLEKEVLNPVSRN